MAGSLRGITIEIGGNTTKLQSALRDVNREAKNSESALRAIDRALKFDPADTTLLTARQEELAKAIENTEERLKLLKKADESAKEQLKRGEIGIEDYAKLRQEIGKAERDLQKFKGQADTTAQALKKFGKQAKEIGGDINKVGTALTKGLTVPLTGIVTAAGVAWKELDEVYDGIATATGAVGDDLEGFHDTFRKVYGELPVEASKVGDAIGELNTQFGIQSEELEAATSKMSKFVEINDTDVVRSVQGAKGVIEAMGLETEDLGDVLDGVTVAAQNTGVGVDRIFDAVKKAAPQLQQMGMSAGDAAMFVGQLEQAGLDSSRAIAGLTRAQAAAAKEGKGLNDALAEFQGVIDGSASEAEKLNAAVELFGTRNGPAMYNAAKQGAINFDELGQSAGNAAGVVERTWEETLDPIDKTQVAMNNLKLAGSELFEEIQKAALPALEGLVDTAQDLFKWFNGLPDGVQNYIVKLGALAIASGPVIKAGGKLIEGFGSLAEKIGKAKESGEGLTSVLGSGAKAGLVAAAVAAAAAIYGLYKNSYKLDESIRSAIDAAKDGTTAFNDMRNELDTSRTFAKDAVDELERLAKQTSLTAEEQSRMEQIVDQLNKIMPDLNLLWDENTQSLNKNVESVRDQVAALQDRAEIEALTEEQIRLEKERLELDRERQKVQDEINKGLESGLYYWDEQKKRYRTDSSRAFVESMAGDKNLFGRIKSSKELSKALDELTEAQTSNAENMEYVTERTTELYEKRSKAAREGLAEEAKAGDELTEEQRRQSGERLDASAREAYERQAIEAEARAKEEAERRGFIARQKREEREAAAERNQVIAEEYEKRLNQVTEYHSALESETENNLSIMKQFGDAEVKVSEATAAQIKAINEKRIKEYRDYSTNMSELAEKVPDRVLEELEKMGPEAAGLIAEYNKMSREELGEHVAVWDEMIGLATTNAREKLAEMPGAAIAEVDAMNWGTRERLEEAREIWRKATADSAEGIPQGLADRMNDILGMSRDVASTIRDNSTPSLWSKGAESADSLVHGMSSKKSRVAAKARELRGEVEKNIKPNTYSIGQALADGVASGMSSKREAVAWATGKLADQVTGTMRSRLQIASPSKVMRRMFQDVGDGIVLGLQDSEDGVEKASADLLKPLTEIDTDKLGEIDVRSLHDAGISVSASLDDVSMSGMQSGVLDLYQLLAENLPKLRQQSVVLDSGALVGGLSERMDRAIGDIAAQKARGV